MITIKTLNENLYQINDTKLELPCSIYKALKITVDIANYEIEQLQDKLTQRNKQVADLKHRLGEAQKFEQDIRSAFFNNTLSQKEFIGVIEKLLNS